MTTVACKTDPALLWGIEMTEISGQLSSESRKYAKDAKNLNLQLLYRKYGPPLIVFLIVLLVIYVRLWWF